MQTNLAKRFRDSTEGPLVESILRKCVHCGFCNATCPTYQLLGNELDGPRGRIYQMKLFFEGEPANAEMLKHLDRCLSCRSCETTCPSGVNYSQLLEVGRHAIEQELPRPPAQRAMRWLLLRFINSGWLFSAALGIGQKMSVWLPAKLAAGIPARQEPLQRIGAPQPRKLLLLTGCVQPTLTPNTNSALFNILQRLGIEAVEVESRQCCGAAAMHSSAPDYGLDQARRLIDQWWPQIESGAEAVLVSASGCGVSVKDYSRLLSHDPSYADKAQRVSELYRDPLEFIEAEIEKIKPGTDRSTRIAFHTPCTMQHGLGINHRVEKVLKHVGYHICDVEEAHLCCGSAGTYSILQPQLSARLRENKQRALNCDQPDVIATANVGCQLQLARGSKLPVVHWLELLEQALA